ncbi:Asparagine synthetase [glutamine-hydrolyzing] 3 [Fundidesulfovibrio magnetotacticus]|uniref:asparagine synthase (glutamine-hydrolyzing) n=1 Tax=Fundidesulfovibrio magnetotacticus TaxID=2730080 RepID=A0A6V8M305_9BACT|nr:asparagine synthase-related protein [Fundidesulfovibrio magnetotacticus]GFK94825.1 Asparagine synthetase [glutamine-hydrolyzing] 3 [Fundidesulfovibrio magnetotacticus]
MTAPQTVRVDLPSFLVETGMPGPAPCEPWAFLAGNPVFLRHARFRPAPFLAERDGVKLCILGSPALGDVIDVQGVAQRLPQGLDDPAFLRSLDGEFLLLAVDEKRGTLTAVSNRFCSPPLFYHQEGSRFAASFAFDDLWRRLGSLGLARVRQDTLHHLLAYKRVFGEGTHEASTRIIPPAAVLRFDGRRVSVERYYRPDYTRKTQAPLHHCAGQLAELIKAAIRRKTSDGARPALFLSGGMDTRTILAAFADMGRPPACFTINQFPNREVQVARKLAETVGAPHTFLPFFPDHYRSVFDKALRLTGALQHPMCMFLGFADQVSSHADVAFHGHGFDYFFQGMYLPAVFPLKPRGHTLYYRYLRRLQGDVTDFFIRNISYRIGELDSSGIVRARHAPELADALRAEVSRTAAEAAEICSSPYDVLEYLTFYNLARHYTFADHWGLNTLLPQRAVSFDNALFDFQQTMPPKHRFDGRLMRACLTGINPKLARIISANHTFPANACCLRLTGYQLRDYVLRKLRLKKTWEDEEAQRMGLPQSRALAQDLRPWVEDVARSERLASVEFLDMDRVRSYVRNFLADPKGPGQLMMSLISIDRLLARLDEPQEQDA